MSFERHGVTSDHGASEKLALSASPSKRGIAKRDARLSSDGFEDTGKERSLSFVSPGVEIVSNSEGKIDYTPLNIDDYPLDGPILPVLEVGCTFNYGKTLIESSESLPTVVTFHGRSIDGTIIPISQVYILLIKCEIIDGNASEYILREWVVHDSSDEPSMDINGVATYRLTCNIAESGASPGFVLGGTGGEDGDGTILTNYFRLLVVTPSGTEYWNTHEIEIYRQLPQGITVSSEKTHELQEGDHI